MKKTLKRMMFILIIVLFVIYGTISFAKQTKGSEPQLVEKSGSYQKWEQLSDEEKKNAIEPLYC